VQTRNYGASVTAQRLNAVDESERNRLKSEQKAWIAARNQL
jgi:uncharacterized protein YecT (DUF1311 family)